MNTCESCAYWGSNGVNLSGICFNSRIKIISIGEAVERDGSDLIRDGISIVGASHIFVGADFGCIHWESRKEFLSG